MFLIPRANLNLCSKTSSTPVRVTNLAMSQHDFFCGLEYATTPNLQVCLAEALLYDYSFVVTPIVHPRFRRPSSSAGSLGAFTRSDKILSPKDWTTVIIGRLSPYLDVDSPSPVVRQRHEDLMVQELKYCHSLILSAVMLSVDGRESNNLGRILNTFLDKNFPTCMIWARVPLTCTKIMRECGNGNKIDAAWNETWLWWSKLHEHLEWDKQVGVVLELSADLPSEKVVLRWLGEPVKAVIVPMSVFLRNKKGYPVLSRAHQRLVLRFIAHGAQPIVSGTRSTNVEFYQHYLETIWKLRISLSDYTMSNYAKGTVVLLSYDNRTTVLVKKYFPRNEDCSIAVLIPREVLCLPTAASFKWTNDHIHNPLQPLANTLASPAYKIFETDAIKISLYEKAIAQALTDLQKGPSQVTNTATDKKTETVTVVVLGAGKGALVSAALKAADKTHISVKVVAVEKNPCVVDVLVAKACGVWLGRDVVVMPGDMREISLATKADIVVSELQGSWGDSALSPESLNVIGGLLKPGGISIPCNYKSYVAPISSPRLWAAARTAPCDNHARQTDKNLETVWIAYMQNKHDIGEAKVVFTFEHPAKGAIDNQGEEMTDYRQLPLTPNTRSEKLIWKVQQDNVLHGFAGYFDCTLYGKEMINTVPSTNNPGMISWFPVFIPIKTPLRVQEGDLITAAFWLRKDSRRAWYEWIVEAGHRTTTFHNTNGRSSQMLL